MCAVGGRQRICIPENYQKYDLPLQTKPTFVTIGVDIKDIPKVSDKDFSITLNAYFNVKWRDPRLQFHTNYGNEELTLKAVDNIWKPDTFFRNDKVTTAFTVPAPATYARISRDGRVLYSVRVKSKLYCPLDLSMFPFDKQTCIMDLASCKKIIVLHFNI